jgi:hypothetical protein
MISQRIYFEINFPIVPTPVSDVWITIANCLEREKCLPKQFYLSQLAGHTANTRSASDLKLTPKEVALLIEERELNAFFLDTGHTPSSVCYSLLHMKEQGNQSVLSCRIEMNAKAPNDWTQLIEALMIQWSSIGGWQWSNLYKAWQGASSFDGYERNVGPIPTNIKTYIQRSHCSLSPDRLTIDISFNPGRFKELVLGIRFYATAEMWLGPHFWQYAKCTKEEVLAADFFLEKRDTPHFLYLKSWPAPFSRPDGAQGLQQQRIWKLFFDEECEWPPGSGGISDKPMYGPPELMP